MTVAVRQADNACVLTVADNGPGIPPEERERGFERFSRVIGTGGEGSGLGSAIVREVVNTAGGTIALGSPAAGSRLVATVGLPAVGVALEPEVA